MYIFSIAFFFFFLAESKTQWLSQNILGRKSKPAIFNAPISEKLIYISNFEMFCISV